MKTIRFLTILGFAASLALAAPLVAQDASVLAPKPQPQAQPPNLTFDFSGGTIAQLIALLAKSPGGPVNIIGDPEDMKTLLPAFAMQNAHPSVFARALGHFLKSRGLLLEHAGFQVPGSSDVYTLNRIQMITRSPSRDQFEAMQLAPYLGEQKAEDVIGAIRAAWELDSAHDPAALKIKFHPATSILLVSGPADGIDIAKRVVQETMKRTEANQKRERLEASPNQQRERLQAVADEVKHRREERENATPKPATNPTPKK